MIFKLYVLDQVTNRDPYFRGDLLIKFQLDFFASVFSEIERKALA